MFAKSVNIFFVIIFLISAALQWNDPDPALWTSLYLAGAFLCFSAFRGEINLWLFYAALALFLVLALYLFFIPDGVLSWITDRNLESILHMDDEKPWIETTREFFGLLILCAALLFNIILFRRNRKNNEKEAEKINTPH